MLRASAVSLVPALFLAGACASSSGVPTVATAPERILAVDNTGTVLRQSTADDHSAFIYAAPRDKVWRAIQATYLDLGIEPTVSDPATGQFGSAAYLVPRRLKDRPISQFFECGVGLNGRYVDNGKVTALVITTLSSPTAGTTQASTHVTASLRRTDSATGALLTCSSTGAIEEFLDQGVQKRLSGTP